MLIRTVSSLEKVFSDSHLDDFDKFEKASMMKNEIFSYQIAFRTKEISKDRHILTLRVTSPLADCITIYKVRDIISDFPVQKDSTDSYYLRKNPGRFPDILEPLQPEQRIIVYANLHSLWIEINPNGKYSAGKYPVKIEFMSGEDSVVASETTIEIINAELDKNEFTMTQWFYCDCLMNYYDTEAFDERHWKVIENFMVNAHKYGQNMILTPVLSPELDTHVNGYRNPTQLAEIKCEKGKYTFNFDKLGRWVDLCDKVGIKYLEINHFFTQWGGTNCPQVWATVDGEYKRIFGWDTPSNSEEYKAFLGALIPEMLKYLKEQKNGADRRCRFHLSDEPSESSLERYKTLYEIVKPLIGDLPTMDALSSYAFYEKGLVDCPIPYTEHAEEFASHNVKNLWTYYCCGPVNGNYSNRFVSMPSARTRILGVQLYKFNIVGYLHWGYNFWNSFLSYSEVNPFVSTDGEGFGMSGDHYMVYPGLHGKPWPSIRQLVFNEGLQDRAALSLCEKLIGREKTIKLLGETKKEQITFNKYPHGNEYIIKLRQKVNEAIKKHIDK